MQPNPTRREWIAARIAEHRGAERAKNPALTAALDRIDAAFPHPNPKSLEERYPFLALAASMEWAKQFGGAKSTLR